MIGTGLFKERGLTLTQKPPQELENGEARFRKRSAQVKGKSRPYYELTVKCDDVFSISCCDWEDFTNETARGLGAKLVAKLLDKALDDIYRHKEKVHGHSALEDMLDSLEGAEIPEDYHRAAITLYQIGEPVTFDGHEWVIVAMNVDTNVVTLVDMRAEIKDAIKFEVKAALVKPVDIVAKSKGDNA